ncbi:hypothetical protein HBE96_00370 [Clostridium sp. P21]|uniref:HTH crp-type domain-containing protein n=1 Tax=Clostridium muellerianum TaxID=2716538 RepID=A0A7Y0ECX3_9CLOT|nr:hypothetical protein [Clostridium muellerianum]NMM61181.1 hypothetical protein [Clostridium muellerianum]
MFAEYEKLCGVTHGGSRGKNYPLITQEDIAKELGVDVRTIQRLKKLQTLSSELHANYII